MFSGNVIPILKPVSIRHWELLSSDFSLLVYVQEMQSSLDCIY